MSHGEIKAVFYKNTVLQDNISGQSAAKLLIIYIKKNVHRVDVVGDLVYMDP